MSNYQRLISYIYTYEGGIKGKNIGFAKLEARGSQCRITVNVKKIFVGGNPIGVYLLAGKEEIRIGTLFARNGAGEFRTMVHTQDVEHTGRSLDECYGLTIHDTESAWRSYTTIWEDSVAHAAEVELADVTAKNVSEKTPYRAKPDEASPPEGHELRDTREGIQNEASNSIDTENSLQETEEDLPETRIPTQREARAFGAPSLPISDEIEKDLEREELKQMGMPETQIRPRKTAPEPVVRLYEKRSENQWGNLPELTEEPENAPEENRMGTEEEDAGIPEADGIARLSDKPEVLSGQITAGPEPENEVKEVPELSSIIRPKTADESEEAGVKGPEAGAEITSGLKMENRPKAAKSQTAPGLKPEAEADMQAGPDSREDLGKEMGKEQNYAAQASGAVLESVQESINSRLEILEESRPAMESEAELTPQEILQNQAFVPGGLHREMRNQVSMRSGTPLGRVQKQEAAPVSEPGASASSSSGFRPAPPPAPDRAESSAPVSGIVIPFKETKDTRTEQEMWEMLRKRYPKILAFDYADGCEILTIKPQDIGLLPREVWVYGNNSFLLHGYYSFRYLILARLNNPSGPSRYLLGIPGHYYSNEKYMASMFGFSDFVLSKKQPPKDGRFGYWYTDIKIGD